MRYWLMKSEPETYGIDHLAAAGVPSMWEGCRSYTVRNYLRDEMNPGDQAFFYHSNSEPSGIVGTMEVVGQPYPDPTQWDPKSEYYDPKSPRDNPRWFVRDMVFRSKFARTVSLAELRTVPGLEQMLVVRKGQRLSVMPVTPEEWAIVLALPGI
ncbi:MAG: EVE domain-containing protein [Fimbriimonas ginsengisoli]|uniref:EVE domain-containing protein n=1 Tax=Fimbriimonas ginsengisoli TaxID=1005039 RepID=A0A931LX41_FIMGI|nr:EVE domain-containing protein [Fimbriimonas ginsengisoli]